MTKEELKEILDKHSAWLGGYADGIRANLSGVNLSGVNLYRADLSRANLYGADLSIANLYGADLSIANLDGANLYGADLSIANLDGANLYGADLSRANLSIANLYGANLSEANLSEANLSEANLSGANLSGANLSRANLADAKLPHFQIPQDGSLIVWKACGETLVKLRVPPTARRTASLIGRKCRAEFVQVVAVENGGDVYSRGNTLYRSGEFVYPDSYDDDVRVECAHGIHFFLTKEEALEWAAGRRW